MLKACGLQQLWSDHDPQQGKAVGELCQFGSRELLPASLKETAMQRATGS